MGVTLTYATAAAFPDRPTSGPRQGLRLTMTTGAGTAWVTRTFTEDQSFLCARVMVAWGTLSGGTVTVLQGWALDASIAWSLRLNGVNHSMELVTDGHTAAIDCSATLAWSCIEVEINALAGTATITLNGLALTAQTLTGRTIASTYRVRVGAPARDGVAVGVVDLDELRIATRRVGPLVVPPVLEHAADPRRWLLVYNRDVADSVTVAEQYRAARAVPYANCVGLSLGSSESMSAANAAALRSLLTTYLADNHLSAQVRGVVLSHRVPGLVDDGRSLAAALADPTHAGNPSYASGDTLGDRTALGRTAWLVGELDCPTAAQALLRPTIADALVEARLDGTVLSALRAARDKVLWVSGAWTELTTFVDTLAAQQLRLPPVTSPATAHGHAVEFVAGTTGSVSVAGQLKALLVCGGDGGASTLRSSGSLLGTAIAGGYALGVGFAGSAGGRINLLSFVTALRRGWTIAEALRVALPALDGSWRLAGDPLAVVPFPRSGYELFVRPTRDAAETLVGIAPASANQMVLTGLPANAQCWVRIAAVDRLGQADNELRLLRLITDGSAQVAPPVPNAPLNLVLTPLAGGYIEATWGYLATGQAVAPAGFRIYTAADADQPDWSASVASVGYAEITQFRAVLGPYAHGQRRVVGVRSVASSGAVNPRGAVASAVAQAAVPGAISTWSVEVAR